MKTRVPCLASIGLTLLAATVHAQPKTAASLNVNPLVTTAQKQKYIQLVQKQKYVMLAHLDAQIRYERIALKRLAECIPTRSAEYQRALARLSQDETSRRSLVRLLPRTIVPRNPSSLFPGWRVKMLSQR